MLDRKTTLDYVVGGTMAVGAVVSAAYPYVFPTEPPTVNVQVTKPVPPEAQDTPEERLTIRIAKGEAGEEEHVLNNRAGW